MQSAAVNHLRDSTGTEFNCSILRVRCAAMLELSCNENAERSPRSRDLVDDISHWRHRMQSNIRKCKRHLRNI